MKRKFLSALFVGTAVLLSTSVVSCSDNGYDDDIKNLQAQITANADVIAQLQSLYKAGCVITSVEKTADGVVVTLSDGSSFNLSNGEDADVWTIQNGEWYKNGEATGLPAKGEDAELPSFSIKDGHLFAGSIDLGQVVGADGKDATTTDVNFEIRNGHLYVGDKDLGQVVGDKGDKGDKGEDAVLPKFEIKDGKLYAGGEELGTVKGADGGYYEPNEDGFFYFVDGTTGEKTKTDKSWKANTLSAVMDGDKVIFSNVDGVEGTVTISIRLALKSLVLQPDLYYHGIQAIRAANYQYDALKIVEVKADGDYSTDARTENGTIINWIPDMLATYHLNPSNANHSLSIDRYNFVVLDRDYETRATVQPVINNVADLDGGRIRVRSSYANGELIKNINDDGQVTVVALQYTDGDSTITSDYAAIRRNLYTTFRLNNNTKVGGPDGEHHYWLSAKNAIDDDEIHVFEVLWDETLDLCKLVNTHYMAKGELADIKWDNAADEEDSELKEYGFEYSFELVGYTKGTNVTSESAHAAIQVDDEGHYILRPQAVDANGKQQAYGAIQDKTTIGREPVVRVKLYDPTNKQYVAVGYFKIRIVAAKTVDQDFDYKAGDFTEAGYTIECEPTTVTAGALKWYEVERQILANLSIGGDKSMSMETFRALYELDAYNTNVAKQFKYNETKKEWEELDPKDYLGVITEVQDVQINPTTDVVKWVIGQAQAYGWFVTEKKPSVSTAMRYKLKSDNSADYKYIYITLTWKPSTLNINPVVSLNDEQKTKAYWYEKNTGNHEGSRDDIHGNVEVPDEELKTTDEFIFGVLSTFVGNKVTLDGPADPYKALRESLKYKFHFVTPEVTEVTGASGTKYILGVRDDIAGGYSYMTAYVKGQDAKTAQDIAKIKMEVDKTKDPDAGVITFLGHEDPAANPYGKDLLNYAGHNELGAGKTLTGRVAFLTEVCEPMKTIDVDNGAFNVKYLRPIDIIGGENELEDAVDNGSTADLKLTFIDWRDKTFEKNPTYFDYYGVQSIFVDTDKAQIDATGSYKLITEVSKDIKFTWDDTNVKINGIKDYKDVNFGTITWRNIGNTIDNCNIKVPVTIVYDWGTIQTEIIVKLKHTTANDAKSRR